VNIVVTSDKDVKVLAVRQAFQEVFGKATITGQVSLESKVRNVDQSTNVMQLLHLSEDMSVLYPVWLLNVSH
jgi:non-canonical (house-cleaning) NTP pyrophosphatase